MKITRDERVPMFHEVPLEQIFISNGLVVTFDDEMEQRWRITFRPYQALHVITVDASAIAFQIGRGMYEVLDSDWIEELRNDVTDQTATFMDKAHHYALGLGNNIVEIVAWDQYVIERVD